LTVVDGSDKRWEEGFICQNQQQPNRLRKRERYTFWEESKIFFLETKNDILDFFLSVLQFGEE